LRDGGIDDCRITLAVSGNKARIGIAAARKDLERHAIGDGYPRKDIVDSLGPGNQRCFGLIVVFRKVGKFKHVEKLILVRVRLEILEEMLEHEKTIVIKFGVVGEKAL
jgi:hypothetical protein